MKKALSLILCIVFIVTLLPILPFTAYAETGGLCGENIRWTLDDNGTMIIRGSGWMPSYSDTPANTLPWKSEKSKIKKVVIEEGIETITNDAFKGCTALESVSLPKSMDYIWHSAFEGCTALESIVINDSDGVIGIYPRTFAGCTALKNVTLPNGVDDINTEVFEGCTALESVTIPRNLYEVEAGAFKNCTALSEITFLTTVKTIADDAFVNTAYYNDENNWEDGCLYIGSHLIDTKNNVQDANVKEGTIVLARGAFAGNKSLKSITLPKGIVAIPERAFEGCENLSEVILPQSVESIGVRSFAGCTALKKVFIGSGTTSIQQDSFEGCEDLVIHCGKKGNYAENYAIENNIPCICPTSGSCGEGATWSLDNEGTLTISGSGDISNYSYRTSPPWYGYRKEIKKIVIENGITRIGKNAFEALTGVTSIYIPATLRAMGEFALPYEYSELHAEDIASLCALPFYGEKGTDLYLDGELVETLVIPEGVENIVDCAFYYFTSIKSITIPGSVKQIGNYAFAHCNSVESVTIAEDVTNIGIGAFCACSALKSVTIPKSVTSIGQSAFRNCAGLETVNIMGPALLGDYAFKGTAWYDNEENWVDGILYGGPNLVAAKKDITEANIKEGTMYIANKAFSQCEELQSVKVPDTMVSIGGHAFAECYKLQDINLPEGITSIGEYAFTKCYKLQDTSLPKSITSIGKYAFSYCDGLREVDIPEGVTEIEPYLFYKSKNLAHVALPNSLKIIGEYAFEGCITLGLMILPEGLEKIEKSAFEFCSSLYSVTINSKDVEIAETAFDRCANLKLYGYRDSTTHKFAEKGKRIFYIIGERDIPIGPVIFEDAPAIVPAPISGGGGDSKPKPKVGLANFKTVNTYDNTFNDVATDAWYADTVKTAYEFDLVKGAAEGKFNPTGNTTIAEAITLAARIHSIYNTGKSGFVQGEVWYQVYVDYAIEKGIITDGQFADYNAPATRTEFAEIFAKAIPEADFNAINNIEKGKIPDVAESDDVYLLYNAGILAGSDEAHSFKPDTNIQRSEVATIVTRIVDKEKRVTFEIQ